MSEDDDLMPYGVTSTNETIRFDDEEANFRLVTDIAEISTGLAVFESAPEPQICVVLKLRIAHPMTGEENDLQLALTPDWMSYLSDVALLALPSMVNYLSKRSPEELRDIANGARPS